LATSVANHNALFSDEVSTWGHAYGFMLHTHDNDLESQHDRAVASLTSSVRAQTSHKEVDSDDENEEERRLTLSRKMKTCSDIKDILHDYISI
jgi:hypothetical protein